MGQGRALSKAWRGVGETGLPPRKGGQEGGHGEEQPEQRVERTEAGIWPAATEERKAGGRKTRRTA